VYASSHVLKTVPYFNDRKLPSAFLRGDPANNTLQVLFGRFTEAESKDFSEPLDDNERAENYGYHSDSDLEDDEDSMNAKETLKKAIPHTFNPFCPPLGGNKSTPTDGEHKEWVEKGKVIKIHDVAFITYVCSETYHPTADHLADSRRFCSIFTLGTSSLRRTDRRKTASRGAPRLFRYRKTRSLGRPQSRSTDLQTRSRPSHHFSYVDV
jgi:hypothetical protein